MDNPLFTFLTGSAILLAFIIQTVYYLAVFRKVGNTKPSFRKGSTPFVSVIICARNEAENLKKNLPSVMEQDYPDYEVIVVNDASTDNSEEVLEEISGKYPNLRTTTIKKDEKFSHGKKLAVLVGIKAAKSNYLLFTDADCTTASVNWIRKMIRHFTKKTSFVLGYGAYKQTRGLLNNFIRYDTFFIGLQYLGFALAGKPYMGVGRNLAYRREIFFKNNGFGRQSSLLSGDDDLIVNALATKKNTRVETDPDAHTLSEPPRSWREWFRKKRRHITTAGSYRKQSLFLLGGEMGSRILFYTALVTWIVVKPYPVLFALPASAGILVLRWIIMMMVFHAGAKRLREKQLLLSSLLYDIVSPLLYLGIWMSNLFSTKPVEWK